MRSASVAALFLFLLAWARAAGAQPVAPEIREGQAALAAKPPDLARARAAFERAAASDDDATAANGLFFLGDLEEQAMRFQNAKALYDACIARLPSNRYAQRAATRSAFLRMHSEGGYAPLVRLETVRRDPALSNDPAAIDALVRDAETFPPGPVRVEARLLAAEAYRGRLHRPDEEIGLLWKVVDDPRADVVALREAAAEIIDAHLVRGELDLARKAALRLGMKLDAPHRMKIDRLTRRAKAHRLALAVLGLAGVLATAAIARGGGRATLRALRRTAPIAVIFCAFAASAGAWLASSYETGSGTPFWMIAPVMLAAILLARAWSASGSARPAARVVRAALCASSVFAAALLLMERFTPDYLEGFGL